MHAYVLVPKSFMKFMFSTVYRVTQNCCHMRMHDFSRARACDNNDLAMLRYLENILNSM